MTTTHDTTETLEIYTFLLRSSADGILIASSDKRINHLNPAAAAMLGVTTDEVLNRTPRECFGKNGALINLFERDGEQTLDVRLPRRRLATGIGMTTKEGERVILLQDVTEKRNLETRREMLTKAIAHDLRNPISALGGYASLVERFGDLNEQQDKYLARIRETSSKLYDVLSLLVDLAWIEAGMPLSHVPIKMREIIDKAVKDVEPLAKKHKISIATSLQDPLSDVIGDPYRLHLVIYHLLQNAILYSQQEDNIVIHAWGDDQEVYCSVADQGIGINDDELELIFDRMYRSQDEQARQISGGGLGLTLARTIVDRLGGDIWATSNYGEGSTFTFVLPTVQVES